MLGSNGGCSLTATGAQMSDSESGSGSDAEDGGDRMRDLLASYYGLQGAAPEAEEKPKKSESEATDHGGGSGNGSASGRGAANGRARLGGGQTCIGKNNNEVAQ